MPQPHSPSLTIGRRIGRRGVPEPRWIPLKHWAIPRASVQEVWVGGVEEQLSDGSRVAFQEGHGLAVIPHVPDGQGAVFVAGCQDVGLGWVDVQAGHGLLFPRTGRERRVNGFWYCISSLYCLKLDFELLFEVLQCQPCGQQSSHLGFFLFLCVWFCE